MSAFDEMDFDDDENIFDDEDRQLTPEEAFKMVTINRVKGTTVKVELVDEEGDLIELGDVVEQLLEYIKDKMEDGNNQFMDQVMPLVAQGTISALGRIAGLDVAAAYLANDHTRAAFINSMAVGFLLLKFVQQNKISINTIEEKVSEEEIEDIIRRTRASSVATMASMSGLSPVEVLREMVNQELISEEDLSSIMGKTHNDNDDDDDL